MSRPVRYSRLARSRWPGGAVRVCAVHARGVRARVRRVVCVRCARFRAHVHACVGSETPSPGGQRVPSKQEDGEIRLR